jgi:hypothetical protein
VIIFVLPAFQLKGLRLRVYGLGDWFVPCEWDDHSCHARTVANAAHGIIPLSLAGYHHYAGSWLHTVRPPAAQPQGAAAAGVRPPGGLPPAALPAAVVPLGAQQKFPGGAGGTLAAGGSAAGGAAQADAADAAKRLRQGVRRRRRTQPDG